MPSLCEGVQLLRLLQRTRPGVLPCRPRAPREAARLNRVRVDCSASSSPEKAWKVTESLRHSGSEGRRGGFPHGAVEAWHVQRRHALRSGAFDNIPLDSAQFQGGRGHLEALQCYGVDVVGATCLFSARKPSCAWGERRATGCLWPSSRSRRTPPMPGDSFWKIIILSENLKTNHFFVSQENHFFLMRRRLHCVIGSSLDHCRVRWRCWASEV